MATIIKDEQGNANRQIPAIGGESLTDTRTGGLAISALNGEVVIDVAHEHSLNIDVRGTFVATLIFEVAFNGVDYVQYPIFNPVTESYVASITAAGQFEADIPAGAKKVRIRASAYGSGSATIYLRATTAMDFVYSKPIPTTLSVQATGALSASVTDTLPQPGAGLFHYITRIRISKYCGAALTPGAAPSIVSSTNLNGNPSFDFKTLGSQGDSEVLDIAFTGNPLKSSASNTATTFVAPVLTGALWKITVFYYIGA